MDMQVTFFPDQTMNRVASNRLLQHLLYWVCYVSFFGIVWGSYDFDFKKTFTIQLLLLPLHAGMVYFVIYFLLPRFLYRKKVGLFFLYFWITLLVTALINRYIDYYIILVNFFPHWYHVSVYDPITMLTTVIKLNFALAIPVTVKVFDYFSSIQRDQREQESKRVEAELALLRSQVHPHFLFNILNSLYSLILKKSDQAKDVVLRLSGLLRYLLYETTANSVPLDQEINFIRDYLELERIRFGNSLQVEWNIKGDPQGHLIAPMLIMPFVENAIKHSSGGLQQAAVVKINMELTSQQFALTVHNSIAQKDKTDAPLPGGVGLPNVEKRLALLYPGNYFLDIKTDKLSHHVTLILNL
ncbi:MAG: hypothetical protein E6Q24_11780 [Chitinophagaceae bacterium]|nr:MAG: hypothetical protein E6Q24_11780 [Chitinophagaceae bacterium]